MLPITFQTLPVCTGMGCFKMEQTGMTDRLESLSVQLHLVNRYCKLLASSHLSYTNI
jgi:hypothetical protein